MLSLDETWKILSGDWWPYAPLVRSKARHHRCCLLSFFHRSFWLIVAAAEQKFSHYNNEFIFHNLIRVDKKKTCDALCEQLSIIIFSPFASRRTEKGPIKFNHVSYAIMIIVRMIYGLLMINICCHVGFCDCLFSLQSSSFHMIILYFRDHRSGLIIQWKLQICCCVLCLSRIVNLSNIKAYKRRT